MRSGRAKHFPNSTRPANVKALSYRTLFACIRDDRPYGPPSLDIFRLHDTRQLRPRAARNASRRKEEGRIREELSGTAVLKGLAVRRMRIIASIARRARHSRNDRERRPPFQPRLDEYVRSHIDISSSGRSPTLSSSALNAQRTSRQETDPRCEWSAAENPRRDDGSLYAPMGGHHTSRGECSFNVLPSSSSLVHANTIGVGELY